MTGGPPAICVVDFMEVEPGVESQMVTQAVRWVKGTMAGTSLSLRHLCVAVLVPVFLF